MAREGTPWRLFLDTGVIIAGCTQPWGASKAVPTLATQRQRFTVVLAEAVQRELDRVLARRDTARNASRDARRITWIAGEGAGRASVIRRSHARHTSANLWQ